MACADKIIISKTLEELQDEAKRLDISLKVKNGKKYELKDKATLYDEIIITKSRKNLNKKNIK